MHRPNDRAKLRFQHVERCSWVSFPFYASYQHFFLKGPAKIIKNTHVSWTLSYWRNVFVCLLGCTIINDTHTHKYLKRLCVFHNKKELFLHIFEGNGHVLLGIFAIFQAAGTIFCRRYRTDFHVYVRYIKKTHPTKKNTPDQDRSCSVFVRRISFVSVCSVWISIDVYVNAIGCIYASVHNCIECTHYTYLIAHSFYSGSMSCVCTLK